MKCCLPTKKGTLFAIAGIGAFIACLGLPLVAGLSIGAIGFGNISAWGWAAIGVALVIFGWAIKRAVCKCTAQNDGAPSCSTERCC